MLPAFPKLKAAGGMLKLLEKSNLVIVLFLAFVVNACHVAPSLNIYKSIGWFKLPRLPQSVAMGELLAIFAPNSTFTNLGLVPACGSPPTIKAYHFPLFFTTCMPSAFTSNTPPRLPKSTAVGLLLSRLLPKLSRVIAPE